MIVGLMELFAFSTRSRYLEISRNSYDFRYA